jgi:hypothetical protein
MDTEKLDIFVRRMEKLGIIIKCAGNVPWIYLDYINGVRVTEKFMADHGFTIYFLPVSASKSGYFADIGETFKLIRKYVK